MSDIKTVVPRRQRKHRHHSSSSSTNGFSIVCRRAAGCYIINWHDGVTISSGVTAAEYDTALPSGGWPPRLREAERGLRRREPLWWWRRRRSLPNFPQVGRSLGRAGLTSSLAGESGNNAAQPPSFSAQTQAPLSVLRLDWKSPHSSPAVIVFGASHYTVWQKQPVSRRNAIIQPLHVLQILPHHHRNVNWPHTKELNGEDCC